MKKIVFALLTLASIHARAEGLPDLGDASQDTLSPQMERQIGQQSLFEIRADKSYLDDAEINDYLNQLGDQLAAYSTEPGRDFEFFSINNNAINAFALPGGFIGVNSGLILTAQSESELAAVLSHEIAHVTQHHIARLISGQKYDTAASIAAMALAILAARSNPQAAQAAMIGAQANAIQRQLDFTRSYEQEADRLGVVMLQKAGFDVHAMPIFFERMQRATRLLDNASLPTYLRTHPVTNERIADIGNRVQQIPYKLVADGLSFHLVRAKLLAMQKTPQEGVAYFTAALGPQRFGNQTAQRYGLVLALLRNNQPAQAAQEFAPLAKQATHNPMLLSLSGQLKRSGKEDKSLFTFYRNATQAFPHHRALLYDYVMLLLDAKRPQEALKLLEEESQNHPSDVRLYELEARTYAAMNKPKESHRAYAYALMWDGKLAGAVEQLELAKRNGTDYHQDAAIDSELKQLREVLLAQQQKRH